MLALPSLVLLLLWSAELHFQSLQFALQVVNLQVKFSDNALGEMGSFCQFVLDLFLDGELLLKCGYLLFELLIFEDEFFGLFGLVFKL